jgi:hypothetical protein
VTGGLDGRSDSIRLLIRKSTIEGLLEPIPGAIQAEFDAGFFDIGINSRGRRIGSASAAAELPVGKRRSEIRPCTAPAPTARRPRVELL